MRIPKRGRRFPVKRFPAHRINKRMQMAMSRSTMPWNMVRMWRSQPVRKRKTARPIKAVVDQGKQMIRTGRLSGSGGMSVSRRGVGV